MTNGEDRLDRVERILEETALRQQQLSEEWCRQLRAVNSVLEEMAARQRYHDEAHDRHDAAIKTIIEAARADGENIRALARIAEADERRLDDSDGSGA